jgi:hypothetical protein
MKKFKLNTKKLNELKEKFKTKTSDNEEINIFELGTLIQFETHAWQARKKLPSKITRVLTPKANRTLVRANKDIIDKSHLQQINSIILEARNFIFRVTNPFPIKGIHFINNELVPMVKERMTKYQEDLKEEVIKFKEQYDTFIHEAENELGPNNLFDKNDYPPVSQIGDKFSINYRFFDLSIPKNITEEMKQEEMDNFKSLMKQTKEMGVLALREGFAEIVGHLTDTLTGKLDGEKRRLHQESINKVEDFFNMFQQKNIFKDDQLEKIINEAMGIINGVDSKDLRNDNELTKEINNQLMKVQEKLDSCITTYKRKVSFI